LPLAPVSEQPNQALQQAGLSRFSPAATLVEAVPAEPSPGSSARFVVEETFRPAEEALAVLAQETLEIPVKQAVDSLVRPLVESVGATEIGAYAAPAVQETEHAARAMLLAEPEALAAPNAATCPALNDSNPLPSPDARSEFETEALALNALEPEAELPSEPVAVTEATIPEHSSFDSPPPGPVLADANMPSKAEQEVSEAIHGDSAEGSDPCAMAVPEAKTAATVPEHDSSEPQPWPAADAVVTDAQPAPFINEPPRETPCDAFLTDSELSSESAGGPQCSSEPQPFCIADIAVADAHAASDTNETPLETRCDDSRADCEFLSEAAPVPDADATAALLECGGSEPQPVPIVDIVAADAHAVPDTTETPLETQCDDSRADCEFLSETAAVPDADATAALLECGGSEPQPVPIVDIVAAEAHTVPDTTEAPLETQCDASWASFELSSESGGFSQYGPEPQPVPIVDNAPADTHPASDISEPLESYGAGPLTDSELSSGSAAVPVPETAGAFPPHSSSDSQALAAELSLADVPEVSEPLPATDTSEPSGQVLCNDSVAAFECLSEPATIANSETTLHVTGANVAPRSDAVPELIAQSLTSAPVYVTEELSRITIPGLDAIDTPEESFTESETLSLAESPTDVTSVPELHAAAASWALHILESEDCEHEPVLSAGPEQLSALDLSAPNVTETAATAPDTTEAQLNLAEGLERLSYALDSEPAAESAAVSGNEETELPSGCSQAPQALATPDGVEHDGEASPDSSATQTIAGESRQLEAAEALSTALATQAEALVDAIDAQLEAERAAIQKLAACFSRSCSNSLLAAPAEIITAPAPPVFDWIRTPRPILQPLAPQSEKPTQSSGPQAPTLAGPCLPPELRNLAELQNGKPARKSRPIPGWVASLMGATLLVFLTVTSLQYFGAQSDAKANTPAGAQPASSASSFEALDRTVEISGLRLARSWTGKQQVRFLIVNHSARDLSGVTLQVVVRSSDLASSSAPILLIHAPLRSLGPYQSKEIRTDLDSEVPVGALSDWQSLHTEVQVSRGE
jgi:hypothetical protein